MLFGLLIFAAYITGMCTVSLLLRRGLLEERPTWVRIVAAGTIGIAVVAALQLGVYAAYGFPDRT